MKPTHELTEGQYSTLISFSDENTVNSFLEELNDNYGAGEVLRYEHMLDIFAKKYNSEEGQWLTIYVDTVRMLRLVVKDDHYVLMVKNYSELKKLHDDLSKKVRIDKALAPLYETEVGKYAELNQTVSNIRFELIANIEELKTEGSSMEHCVATYASIIAQGHYIAFRVIDENNNGRFTLGVYKNMTDDSPLSFDQLKGFQNSPASVPACLATVEFCNKNGIRVSVEKDYDLYPIKRIE